MGEVPLAGLGVALVHRKVDHPAEGQLVGIAEAELPSDRAALLAEHGAGRGRRPDRREHGIAGDGPDGIGEGGDLGLGELAGQGSLGLGRVELQPGADDPGHAGRVGEGVEPLAGAGGAAGDAQGPDGVALGRRLEQHRQLRGAAQRGGEIGDGQVEAQVRFVGAVSGDGVGEGQAGKRGLRPAWSSVP